MDALENALLDQTMDPTPLPLSLLKYITDDFSGDQEIGRGGYGAVYKGVLRNGSVVAVKKLNDVPVIPDEDFQSEVDFLRGARHKNTVRLLGFCSDTQCLPVPLDDRTSVWADVRHRLLCFELLQGSLANYITDASSGLPWSTRYEITRGLCEGVHYLRENNIIHMDLKPQNILLDDHMTPKITDFGLSRRFSENQSQHITKNIAGSFGYMAPEFLKRNVITFKTDIFSLGVIIMEMLMGCKETHTVEEVLESWRNGVGTPESHVALEQVEVCAEIALQCMVDDLDKRPTSWDIILRIFDEEEISNWSARGAQSTSSIPHLHVSSFADKLRNKFKSMNMYGRPFLPKRVGALMRAKDPSIELNSYGLTHTDLFDIHPLELRFPSEANGQVSCALSLTNKTDRDVFCMMLPEHPSMFEHELYGNMPPKSTCGAMITMVEQQEGRQEMNNLCIMMITTESAHTLSDLQSYIESDNDAAIDPVKQIKELGGQMYLAMLTARFCPQSEIITPKIIFTKEFESVLYGSTIMDVHPTEPWLLIVEKNIQVSIWDYQTKAVVMSFESNEELGLVRKMLEDNIVLLSAKFIPRGQWFVTGDRSGNIRVYSYVPRKVVKKFSAYFRSPVHILAVHPTDPLLLSESDGHSIKLFNWDMGWKCVHRVNRGYTSPCIKWIKFDPKDAIQFVVASRTFEVWAIHDLFPSIKINLPERYIPTIGDYPCTDNRQLITATEDGGLGVYDFETESCVHTLVLEDSFIASVACHPTLPVIVTCSYDGDQQTICFWNAANYRLLNMFRRTEDRTIHDLAFGGSRRLVIKYYKGIEVLEIDLEALACQK